MIYHGRVSLMLSLTRIFCTENNLRIRTVIEKLLINSAGQLPEEMPILPSH
jgi:hypothetical protein